MVVIHLKDGRYNKSLSLHNLLDYIYFFQCIFTGTVTVHLIFLRVLTFYDYIKKDKIYTKDKK